MTGTYLNYASIIFSVVLGLTGILLFGWMKLLKGTNKLLIDQNLELRALVVDMQGKIDVSAEKICSMQGQIDILKNVPLGNIDKSLACLLSEMKKSTVQNAQTLKLMQGSAKTLAEHTAIIGSHVAEVRDELARHREEESSQKKESVGV
jgi:septal ring factor EnvC (AmiA/AmiB activator)